MRETSLARKIEIISSVIQKLEAQEVKLQQASPPEATASMTQNQTENIDALFEIKFSKITALPELVCSFNLVGNVHRVHFSVNGKIASISSHILIDDINHDVKVYIENNSVTFLPIKKNNVLVESSIAEAERLWDIIKIACHIAEKKYSPDVHEAKEKELVVVPEVTRTLNTDEKIKAILEKWHHLKCVFDRVVNHLGNTKKHRLDASIFAARFKDLYKQCLDFESQLDAILSESSLTLEQHHKLLMIKVGVKELNVEILTISLVKQAFLAQPLPDSSVFISLTKADGSTLRYFFTHDDHFFEVCFNAEGEASVICSTVTYENIDLRCVVTFSEHPVTGKKMPAAMFFSAEGVELTQEDQLPTITEKILLAWLQLQVCYSPVVHEETVLRTQGAPTDQAAAVSRLFQFFQRVQSCRRFLISDESSVLSVEKKEYCRAMLSVYIDIFANRLVRLEHEINNACLQNHTLELQAVRNDLIVLRKLYDNAYQQPVQSKAKKQPTKEAVAESEKMQELLLKEEELEKSKKKPEKKSEKKSVSDQVATPKAAFASNEERKFDKDFESLNKLMGEKLTYFKRSQKTISEVLKTEIAVIKTRFEALKKYYDDHALGVNERVKNKFTRLGKLWSEIQTFIPVEREIAQVDQEDVVTSAQSNPLSSATAATELVGAGQRLLPAPRWRHDPYAVSVLAPEI